MLLILTVKSVASTCKGKRIMPISDVEFFLSSVALFLELIIFSGHFSLSFNDLNPLVF